MADIDHFKEINDSLGHGAGDLALKEFTRRHAGKVRESRPDWSAVEAEEFLIIVAGACDTPSSEENSAAGLRQDNHGLSF